MMDQGIIINNPAAYKVYMDELDRLINIDPPIHSKLGEKLLRIVYALAKYEKELREQSTNE